MRLSKKIIIVFSIVILCAVSSVSYVSFRTLESAVVQSGLAEMQHEVQIRAGLVESLHSRASEDILFAVKNPVFVRYFELPETRQGDRYDANGIMQFTDSQKIAKAELEQWIYEFQSKFHVDETCLIDHFGQEHARLVLEEIAPVEDLSSEEGATPFFAPSFQTEVGEVYIQAPYVSPDTERWVFAYTTPIVISDGSKPAFYHFEMPLNLFQDLLAPQDGRMYVVDENGLVIADSANKYYNGVGSSKIGTLPENYFHKIDAVSDSSELFNIIKSASAFSPSDQATGTYTDGEVNYVAYQKLPTFGWILVYEKPYSLLLAGDTNLSLLGTELAAISIAIGAAGLGIAFLTSTRIASPITKLASALRSQKVGQLEKVQITTSTDEVSDVTNAVNELVTKVNTLEKQKDEFATMIIHELRTPLTPILAFCQILKSPRLSGSSLTPKQEEAIDTITGNARRLQQLVSDVLDAQKLDLQKLRFNCDDMIAHDIIKSVKANFEDAAGEKKITFVDSTREGPAIAINSDRGRLEQVLSNLVVNAIDFVRGDGLGQIEIGVKEQGKEVLFYVKDNGTGISIDKQKQLFTKFYQVETSVTRKHRGSGLGLAICKGIVESLGGNIWVESEEGKGAVFSFTLPRADVVPERNTVESSIPTRNS